MLSYSAGNKRLLEPWCRRTFVKSADKCTVLLLQSWEEIGTETNWQYNQSKGGSLTRRIRYRETAQHETRHILQRVNQLFVRL